MHRFLFNIRKTGSYHWTNRIISAASLAEAWKKIVKYADEGYDHYEFVAQLE